MNERVFRGFANRDRDLRTVTRFSLYDVMYYRTNLYTHSQRVAAIVRHINPWATEVFGSGYDPIKAELLGYVHDDAEMIFGDIQAGNKSKMTAAQLQEVTDAEQRAIAEISKRFPASVAGYTYKDLLEEAADYPTLESQVMCYADKYDALGEGLHEIYAGNRCFTINVVNKYGSIPTPPQYYAGFFAKFADRFPDMRPLLATSHTIFKPVVDQDYARLVGQFTPYTKQSLGVPTGNLHYDNWRQIVMADTNAEVVRDLYIQKEFAD